MIGYETSLGTVEISQGYFTSLIANAVSECYGVAGMVNTAYQGMMSMVSQKEVEDSGIVVRSVEGRLVVDIHIAVTYGVNIAAIVKSIVHKVHYTVEQSTGFEVSKVNVYVDSMKAQ